VFLLARSGAPAVYQGLARSTFALPIHAATAAAALCALGLLLKERYRLARFAAATQVALVIVGWGLSMGDAIVVPDVTLANAGTRAVVVNALLPALAIGAGVLAPSLWYLFRVFKSTARGEEK
jgi:cytochrome d ubiquinol oxidase subunit II